jgi:hypothetical protein
MVFQFGQARLQLRDFGVFLEPAADGYLLKIVAEASHSGLSNGCPVSLTGDVRLDGGSWPCVGLLHDGFCSGPLVLRELGAPVIWFVPLSYEALDAIERHRYGGDLGLVVRAHALLLGDRGTTDWPEVGSQVSIPVTVGDWVRQLEQVSAAAGLYVVVHPPPYSGDTRRSAAVGYLRTARRLLAGGDYGQAVAEARKVLDVLDEIDPLSSRRGLGILESQALADLH